MHDRTVCLPALRCKKNNSFHGFSLSPTSGSALGKIGKFSKLVFYLQENKSPSTHTGPLLEWHDPTRDACAQAFEMQPWLECLHLWGSRACREDVLVCPFTTPRVTWWAVPLWAVSTCSITIFQMPGNAESKSCPLWEGAWVLVVRKFMLILRTSLWETGKWRCHHEREDPGRGAGAGKDIWGVPCAPGSSP